jgi:hypothetical protein
MAYTLVREKMNKNAKFERLNVGGMPFILWIRRLTSENGDRGKMD